MTQYPNSTSTIPCSALAKLRLRVLPPKTDVTAARKAFTALEPQLPEPSLLEYITPHSARLSGASLFYTSKNPDLQEFPEVLFSKQRELAPGDFPEEWLDAYLRWGQNLRRGQQLELLHDKCLEAMRGVDPEGDLASQHPAVAAATLYLLNLMPDAEIRHSLKKIALETAVGAYVCGQGLILAEEREVVVEALKGASKFLFWLSQTAGFRSACVRAAKPHYDLWGGLTLLQADETNEQLGRWLEGLALAALEHPAAACAALVLQPQMERPVRDMWLSTLVRKPSPRYAVYTARFARLTSTDWAQVADKLRHQAMADHGRMWHNWLLLAQPDQAQKEVDSNLMADPLWCIELIEKLNLNTDGLRYRMSEQHASRLWDRESTVVLEWINARSRRFNGTAV